MRLKVATFNINKNDGDFPNRIYKIASNIGSLELDFLALQEDFSSKDITSSSIINSSLNYNINTTSLRKKVRYGVDSHSNLTTLSKYPIVKSRYEDFTLESDDQRGVLICETKINKLSFTIVNTHLSHLGANYRDIQIKKLLQIFSQNKSDVIILCGDFNSHPDTNVIKMIEKSGFVCTNQNETCDNRDIIDYIFIKCKLDFEASYETKLEAFSDHNCLIADIKLQNV